MSEQLLQPLKFQTNNLTIEDLHEVIAHPYVDAMDKLFKLTSIPFSRSRYFTKAKIDLWEIMPAPWRMTETIQFIEQEHKHY